MIYIFDTDVVKEIAGPFDVTMTRAQTKQTSDFPICALRILEPFFVLQNPHFSYSSTETHGTMESCSLVRHMTGAASELSLNCITIIANASS